MPSSLPIDQRRTEIDEYHKLELNEIFERTRLMISIRMQASAFLGTANFSVVGLAFSTQRAGLFFIAVGIGAIYLAIDSIAGEYSKPLYARGVQLEDKYASDATDAILHRRLKSYTDRKGYSYLATRIRALVSVTITLAELASGVLLWISGWRIF